MKPGTWSRKRTIILPLLLIGMAIPLAIVYFSWGDTFQSTKRQLADFYPRIRLHWMRMDEDKLNRLLETGSLDRFQTYAVRGALSRWRMQQEAPEAFSEIMREYGDGLWLSADEAEWRRAFEKNDARWIRARRAAMNTPQVTMSGTKTTTGVALDFGATTTADLGSLLWIVFETDEGNPTPNVARLLWRNSAQDYVADYKVRLLPARPVDRVITPGKRAFAYEADMSWEPAWLRPDARDIKLTIELPNPELYSFVNVVGGNSPYLPVR